MKKYKLLKDHPYAKAGEILNMCSELDDEIFLESQAHVNSRYIVIPKDVVKEWLEPVKTKWEPKSGEEYYYVDGLLEIECCIASPRFDNSRGSELVFRTCEQAEEAAKRVKACLEAYHEEIGE